MQYLESADNYVRQGERGRRHGLGIRRSRAATRGARTGLRDAMTRMRGVLHRVETRVIAEANRSGIVTAWVIGGACWRPRSRDRRVLGIAKSIAEFDSRRWVRSRRRWPPATWTIAATRIGSDEVSGLARMINLLADTMQGMLTRLRSEAGRSTFSNQLVEALEMADSEAEADRVIARAMGAISDVHPMELLLADSSRAHLERACVHPKNGSPNCGVESPYSCIAVRRGHAQIFPDAEALNACPEVVRAAWVVQSRRPAYR